MEVTNSLSSVSNNIYPICYKIKETSYQASCINKLAKYVKLKKRYMVRIQLQQNKLTCPLYNA